jgi:membrane-associated protease RseP (regulator of RpoE activity)
MVFLIIEKLKGSPVSVKVQTTATLAGLVLIASLFLFVTYNDIVRLF